MTCLTDDQIQTMTDGEASEAVRQHAAACRSCGARVRTHAHAMEALSSLLAAAGPMPAPLARRVEAALASTDSLSHDRRVGATRLRAAEASSAPSWWMRAAWGGAAAATATLVAVLVVAPLFRGPATVSASEILAASATRLAQPRATGVEILSYELVLDGVPREMMPDHADGTYQVWQAIDHDRPGRFHFATIGPDGRLLSSIAQDPAAGRRVMLLTLEGQPYRFEMTVPADPSMSLPELQRLHLQAVIAMMQARGDQLLQVDDTSDGRKYRIEVPRISTPSASPVWDLTDARVVIDADDFRVEAFAVSGVFLKQPYSISYTLTQRVPGAVTGDPFDVPPQPGQIELSGEGSSVPARDAMVLALREIARLKQAR